MPERPVRPGHLSLGGSFRHELKKWGKCLLCGSEQTMSRNGKFCPACRKEAARRRKVIYDKRKRVSKINAQ